jgi:hypothetical protein
MSKVTVTADVNGNVIGISQNNPDYGYIRVEQVATQINDEGWLKHVRRSALIKGLIEDLTECNYGEDHEISGKIVVRESLTPFSEKDPDRDLKIAGQTGIICRLGDQPIYRQTFFTTNIHAQDEFITHDNSDEIRDVQGAQREISSLKLKTVAKKTTKPVEL